MNAPLRHQPVLDIPRTLPEPVLRALDVIADELRHAPRDVLVDRYELVNWLNRLARRVEGVTAMKVPMEPQPARPVSAGCAVPAIKLVDAVFGRPAKVRRTRSRTVTSRKGKQVRVELRRSMQFDLPFVIPAERHDAALHASGSASRDREP